MIYNIPTTRVLLDRLGYKLLIAKNGQTALSIAQKAKPSLILLDIMMPEIDGYEVCRRLKADSNTANIPIIFITALADDQDEAKGLGLGAVDYITKPINPELVRARVHNHLELKRHQDHLEQLVKERTRRLALTQAVTIESESPAARDAIDYFVYRVGQHLAALGGLDALVFTEVLEKTRRKYKRTHLPGRGVAGYKAGRGSERCRSGPDFLWTGHTLGLGCAYRRRTDYCDVYPGRARPRIGRSINFAQH